MYIAEIVSLDELWDVFEKKFLWRRLCKFIEEFFVGSLLRAFEQIFYSVNFAECRAI